MYNVPKRLTFILRSDEKISLSARQAVFNLVKELAKSKVMLPAFSFRRKMSFSNNLTNVKSMAICHTCLTFQNYLILKKPGEQFPYE